MRDMGYDSLGWRGLVNWILTFLMNRPTSLLLSIALLSVSQLSFGFTRDQLVGTWCFYQQEAAGNTVKERVTISLQADGAYQWRDSMWHQDGTWRVEDSGLFMTEVGHHRLISVAPDSIEMARGSTMRWRKGACG